MIRIKTTTLAVFAAVTVGIVASAQIYTTQPIPNVNPPGQFVDTGITQTKVGNLTPSSLVTLVPSAIPEAGTTGLAAGTALGFFALSRFIYRKK